MRIHCGISLARNFRCAADRPGLVALRIVQAADTRRGVAVRVAEVEADREHATDGRHEQILCARVAVHLVAQEHNMLPAHVIRLEVADRA